MEWQKNRKGLGVEGKEGEVHTAIIFVKIVSMKLDENGIVIPPGSNDFDIFDT